MRWRLKLRQIEAFRAVMLTGATTHAATALNMTQPTVSRLINDLEDQLGVELFARRRGRLYPTAEGEWLFQESEDTLSRLDRLDRAMRDIRHLQLGELKLVATPPVAYGIFPDALTRFRERHPETAVSVQIAVRREVRTWTTAQRFDVAVMTLPIDYPEHDQERLVSAAAVCILPQGHRLETKRRVTPADLSGENLVTLLPETLTRLRLDRLFESHGFRRHIAVETQTAGSICAFVAAGLGVGLVDPFTAYRFRNQSLVIKRFEPAFPHEYALLFPIRRARTKAAEAFLPALRDSVSAILDWYGSD